MIVKILLLISGLGLYWAMIVGHEPTAEKLVAAEIGSLVLFCGIAAILRSIPDKTDLEKDKMSLFSDDSTTN
ncbi:hypothetical protein KZ483_16550 [Paenibacillus sp. sptzw28]|uniref:hypothetical protein n=1 Tax=Paenibacillus sp. sptzw28 TaxID=715179 RepID=UPI001C6F4E15|nr:hypothetical protein [Paenibacillus sp. sptzw28]QYR19521.1 hypothetical protein KZ483_16550 [Paenibacillus sp. sptzw28]